MFEKGPRFKFQLVLFVFLSVLPIFALSQRPRFNDSRVHAYQGKIHLPKWARHVQGTEWRDALGKGVGPPSVNFAGKYYIAGHSLGTGARYYTLTDLSTGRELSFLDKFATTEDSLQSSNGMHYLITLDSQRTSRLLRVRFQQITWGADLGSCHERYFLLNEEKLLAVGAKSYRCINE